MFCEVDGLQIHYIEAGEAHTEDPLLLLLHGWGSKAELFDGVIRFASARYHCIAPDMPGFGESAEPREPMNVDDYADFVLHFMSVVAPGIREVILLGHSMGGRIIIKLCSRETIPFAVPRIILTDSAGIRPVQTGKQSARTKRYRRMKKLLTRTGIARLFPSTIDALQKKYGSVDYAAASPLMRQTLVRVVNEDLTPYMPQVKQPALLIWGDADTATPLSDGQQMEQLMPEAGLAVIQGAGHYCFLEQPVWYNRILGSFLGIPS